MYKTKTIILEDIRISIQLLTRTKQFAHNRNKFVSHLIAKAGGGTKK